MKNRNLIVSKLLICFMALCLISLCSCVDNPKSIDEQIVLMENYKGYIVVDKLGAWSSMMDASRAYKVRIANGKDILTLYTTQFSYDKWCIGDTIK